MNSPSPKEVDAVSRLDSAARYEHFVKRVVDRERAWGLWAEGWALMGDGAGREIFPLWPAREYAELFAREAWSGFEPAEIGLYELLDELLPKLASTNTLPGIFPVPTGKAVTLSVGELSQALRAELDRYG